MKNAERIQKLRETAWRRPLTPGETAELHALMAGAPGDTEDLQTDVRLTRTLLALPQSDVSPGFTDRVMAAIERESESRWRVGSPAWLLWLRNLGWMPRVAFAAFAVLFVCIGAYRLNASQNRLLMAESMAMLSDAPAAPKPEVLEDFEAIQMMSKAPAADEELLALMQ
jgi:hypothetical protein